MIKLQSKAGDLFKIILKEKKPDKMEVASSKLPNMRIHADLGKNIIQRKQKTHICNTTSWH